MRRITMIKDFNEIINHPFFDEWFKITRPILASREFQKRKLMKHHDDTVFEHCVEVSFEAFKMGKKTKNADIKVCAIGGLLHDFYPKAWQYSESLEKLDDTYRARFLKTHKKSIRNLHGFVHARNARDNALKYYPDLVDKKILNAILRHMFPLNIVPPRYIESWIVTMADKKVSFKKLPKVKEWPKYVGLKTT